MKFKFRRFEDFKYVFRFVARMLGENNKMQITILCSFNPGKIDIGSNCGDLQNVIV